METRKKGPKKSRCAVRRPKWPFWPFRVRGGSAPLSFSRSSLRLRAGNRATRVHLACLDLGTAVSATLRTKQRRHKVFHNSVSATEPTRTASDGTLCPRQRDPCGDPTGARAATIRIPCTLEALSPRQRLCERRQSCSLRVRASTPATAFRECLRPPARQQGTWHATPRCAKVP